MKRVLYIIAVVGLMLQPGAWFGPAVVGVSAQAQGPVDEVGGEMPGYADPPQPIPYNKPGYPSKMGMDTRARLFSTFRPWADRFNRLSPEEQTQMLAYTPEVDPLASNYDLVDWESVAVIKPSGTGQNIRAWKGDEDFTKKDLIATADNLALDQPGPWLPRAGDLNNDGIDELVEVNAGTMKIGNLSQKRFIKGDPAVASAKDEITWLFGRGYDDQLWVLRDTGDWVPLGGTLASSPTAAYVSDGRVDVLALNTENQVQRCIVETETKKCSWYSLPVFASGLEKLVGEPVMTAESSAIQDVFVRSSGNRLWHLANRGGWLAWENLSTQADLKIFNVLASPAATSKGGRIDLAAAWFNNALVHIWRTSDAAAWQWERIGAPGRQFRGAVSIVSTAPGSLDILATGPSTNAAIPYPVVHVKSYRNGSWGGWNEYDAGAAIFAAKPDPDPVKVKTYVPVSGAAAAYIRGTTRVVLYYRAWDNNLYTSRRDAPDAAWVTEKDPIKLLEMWNTYTELQVGRLALGHFLPNGRVQAVIHAYDAGAKILKLYPYEFQGGFSPVRFGPAEGVDVPINDHGQAPTFWQEKVGDYDGDGVEELALLTGASGYVDLYVVKITKNGLLGARSAPVTGSRMERGLIMISGHFHTEDTADEELAVANGDWIWIYDVAANLNITKFAERTNLQWPITNRWAITSGDVIPEAEGQPKLDEIVYAGVHIVDNTHFWPWDPTIDEYRVRTRMVKMNGTAIEDATSGQELRMPDVPWDSNNTYVNVSLVVGDLRRMGSGSIVLLVSKNNDRDLSRRMLAVLEYQPDKTLSQAVWQIDYNDGNNNPPTGDLVIGNLTGEGLRLGKPSYRLTPNMGKLIARVNAPPRILDDGVVKNPGSTVGITVSTTTEESLTVEAKPSWQVDANIKGTLGDENGTHVSASLEGSIGQDFGLVSGTTQTVTHEFKVSSENDEQVYAVVGYQLWEFPVTDNAPELFQEPSSMIAVMPAPGPNSLTVRTPGVLDCSNLFNPGHDINNLLSYAENEEQLPGWAGGERLFAAPNEYTSGPTKETTFQLKFTQGQNFTNSKATNWSVKATVEGEYDGGIGSVSGSVAASYNRSDAATEEVKTTKDLVIDGAMAKLDDQYAHSIKPYFYWDDQGALILDYLTFPGANVAWWGQTGPWAKPDLAFIRPWNGLGCDIVQGQGQDDISPEITFTDSTPLAGADVTVTARMHNYSINAVENVPVKFYQGDPARGGAELASCAQTVPFIKARGYADMTCPFKASGFGEQRIYVVADPGRAIAEQVENNNKAYGLLNVAALQTGASGADPGLSVKKPGISLALNTAGEKQTVFFAPYAALPYQAVTTFKLDQTSLPGRTFTITAFSANSTGFWTSVPQEYGRIMEASSSIPPAAVSVEYTHDDLRPGVFEEATLLLFYWNESKKVWEDQEPICGKVMRDPDNNVVYAPVCKVGTYALMSQAFSGKVYLPLTQK